MEMRDTQDSTVPFRMRGWLRTADTVVLDCDAEFRVPRDDALLLLDCDGDLRLEIRRRFGGDGVPLEEWHGSTQSWTVLEGAAQLDITRLRTALTAGGALFDLMSRVAEGHEVVWERGQYVGYLSEDAEAASELLREAFATQSFATETMVISADSFYAMGPNDSVRADSTDDEIDALAEEDARIAQLDGFIVSGVHEALYAYRDRLRDDP